LTFKEQLSEFRVKEVISLHTFLALPLRTGTTSLLSNTLLKLNFVYTMSCPVISFSYEALLPWPDSIRLLRLLPHEDDSAPIQCQLFNYSLEKSNRRPHPYDALSYVWGGEDKLHSISIDGGDLPVTEQLRRALIHLRHHSTERVLWVDAVCINQGNEREKEQQIQIMEKIYSQANCVIVWLGEEADDSDQVLQTLRIAGSKKVTSSLHAETINSAVLKLLQRKWFRRIWV
jgi:hypothetical protein